MMSTQICTVEYYYTTVKDRPGEAYRLLSELASGEVNLLAFTAVPMGYDTTQLVLFPEDSNRLVEIADRIGLVLTGPQRAFLIQGDDKLGSLVEFHRKLADEQLNIVASTGVTDGRGGYGYVFHVRPEHYEQAAHVLGA
jgi:hypothetical protein